MSRIGKQPIAVPDGVTATLDGQTVKVKGPKGELSYVANDEVTLAQQDGQITVAPRDESKDARSKWGMTRTNVANMIEGVTKGFERKLEINGVGYRAQMQGSDIKLALGFSHDIVHKIPAGITAQVTKPTEIVLSGIDKQAVGQVAANIREYRPPEPYKGKGVKYAEERIVRKEGKKK